MARTVSDPRRSTETPGFGNVVDDICRGQYVLVLGSEIVLDTAENTDARGDSARFFLNTVIERQNVQGRRYQPAENFQEFIVGNALNANEVRGWLLDAVATTEFDDTDLNPDLRRLLLTRCFRVVLTTTYDPAVECLMDEVWGRGGYRVMSIFDSKADFDFAQDEMLGDEYYDIRPTLYYVFGKADPVQPSLRFVLDDNETIDCISRWLGNEAPARLLSYIDSKKLLVIGCNLKDWCFRFFWYAMRHKSADRLNKGDIALLLSPEESEQDRNLYNYLHKTLRIRLQTDSRKYVRRLADALDEHRLNDTALAASRLGGVFISYAHEDYATAWVLFTRLREAGLNVWLDSRLEPSDPYDLRIANAISQAKAFVALLSANTGADLAAGRERYYRREWALAAGPNSDAKLFMVVTPGYSMTTPRDNPYHQLVPGALRAGTAFDWAREPLKVLVAKLTDALNRP